MVSLIDFKIKFVFGFVASLECRLRALKYFFRVIHFPERKRLSHYFLNCTCFCHLINILLTDLSRSVWENLNLGRSDRSHCVRSVLTTSGKILPKKPSARLLRPN